MLQPNESFVYIFSWSLKSGKPGLGLYRFRDDTGTLTFVGMLEEELSYGYAAVDAGRGILYCGVDTPKHPALRAGGGGSLRAYQIDPETGAIRLLSEVSTCCPQPSYVSVDPKGRFVLVSMHSTMDSVTKAEKDAFGNLHTRVEFSDSGVAIFALEEDGSIGRLLDFNIHTGSGPKPRQLQPHAHCAVLAPRGDLFTACDKGNDGIYMYRIGAQGKLSLPDGAPYHNRPGTAPRYCAFHPTRPFLFHNNEMELEIDSYRYDEQGGLEHLATIPVLPADCAVPEGERCGQQDFQIDRSGRYLYAMVHGFYNGLSVFEIDQETAQLTFLQFAPISGVWARDFAFSPDQRYLVTACLSSGDIESFSIGQDGRLTPTGHRCSQSAAACVVFYKPS